jgi:hypothetical protein
MPPSLTTKNKIALSLGAFLFIAISFIFTVKTSPPKMPSATPVAEIANDCTIYASTNGKNSNAGVSSSSPKTFEGAAAMTKPSSILCLLAGTYTLNSAFIPPKSGTPSAWIVYKTYGNGPVNFIWTGPADASSMFDLNGGSFPSNPAYLEFRGLHLDGSGNAADGFFCRGSHHIRFIGNVIENTGGSGIGSIFCDYLTADHNIVNHNGYMPAATPHPEWYSWTSGISYNSNRWYDSYAGFHNIISNNIVVGQYDASKNHSDGNGIILDLSNRTYDPKSANTPPTLVINNVVYGNGGRCVTAYIVTNFWIVNNTCYKNNLDGALIDAGSLTVNNSLNGYFINNISVSWQPNNPPYAVENSSKNILYYANLYFGGINNFKYSNPEQFINADPHFVRPPVFHPTAPKQYEYALPPSILGDGLMLQENSPARKKGIDPSALPGLSKTITNDLKKYIYVDIKGTARPRGSGMDLGAYQIKTN